MRPLGTVGAMSHVLIATDGSDLALSAARAAFAIVPHPEKVTILAISEATPEIVAEGIRASQLA